MVSQRSTPKRSPKRRRTHQSYGGGGGSSSKDDAAASGSSSIASIKYFAEQSDLPPQKIRPPLPPQPQEFVLSRSDNLAAIVPPAPEPKILTIEFDPIVVHTVALLRYRRMLAEPGVTAARIGPVPECSNSKPPLLSSSLDATEQLSTETAEIILRKALELLCAHFGFIEVESRVINLLMRVTASKLQQMWRACKVSNVRRLEGKETAFTSPMMQVLQMAHITKLTNLRDFYTLRFRDRRDQLQALCQKGRQSLLKPPEKRQLSKKRPKRDDDSRSDSDDGSSTRNKRERATDKETSPEINFLAD